MRNKSFTCGWRLQRAFIYLGRFVQLTPETKWNFEARCHASRRKRNKNRTLTFNKWVQNKNIENLGMFNQKYHQSLRQNQWKMKHSYQRMIKLSIQIYIWIFCKMKISFLTMIESIQWIIVWYQSQSILFLMKNGNNW